MRIEVLCVLMDALVLPILFVLVLTTRDVEPALVLARVRCKATPTYSVRYATPFYYNFSFQCKVTQ